MAAPSLDRRVTDFLAPSPIALRDHLTTDEALTTLRGAPRPAAEPIPSQVTYLYVLDADERLVGVLPIRKLILAPAGALIRDLMTRDLVTLRESETLFDALELFAIHRLLAIPIVDSAGRLKGILEVSLYADEVFDLAQRRQLSEVFQLIGLRLEQHKNAAAPLRGFALRMPWLMANITGGLACAALGSFFESTVQKVVLIALFIPLILTLAESIAVQSMTLAIEQALLRKPFPGQLRNEAITAILLGLCTGIVTGLVSLFWRGPLLASLTIAISVIAAMFLAAMLGRTVPKLLRRMRLNPRIASGPITLATVDVVTITVYLSAATVILRGAA